MQELYKNLSNMYVFIRVHCLGSFQAAADELDLPRSSISKKIQLLEQQLQVRLFQRSTRKLALTEAGQSLLNACGDLSQVLQKTEQVVHNQQTEAIGRVKISCSKIIADNYLLPILHEFLHTHSKVVLELNLSDSVVDLIANKIDIAIRVGDLPDSSMVAKNVGHKSWSWAASPNYLKKYGVPTKPSELTQHRCIVFRNETIYINQWHFANQAGEIESVTINEAIAIDDGRSLINLACSDYGIIMLDKHLIASELQQGKLVPIFEDYKHPQNMPINLVCLSKKTRSKAVELLWTFLSENLRL